MERSPKTNGRKKFLLWGAAVLSSLTVLKFLPAGKKKNSEPAGETVKMLTQDGKLVEIDKKLLAAAGKKITNDELKQWIKK